jgi:hypothetical protein
MEDTKTNMDPQQMSTFMMQMSAMPTTAAPLKGGPRGLGFPAGVAAGATPAIPAAATGHGRSIVGRFKKAPDAPKRFKSAFIIFSAEKHKEIKEKHAEVGRTEKTTDIAKLVSEAWRELSPEEREIWEERARKDKARYEVEKSMYKGPWKIPATKRTPKDPSAPKRPMSAFLAFSNKRRAALKRQNPNATNADLSKMLSKTWKEAPDELRRKYMEEEAELRAKYKEEMAGWRKRVAEEKKAERREREAIAMQAAEARAKNPELAAQMMQQMVGAGGADNATGQDGHDPSAMGMAGAGSMFFGMPGAQGGDMSAMQGAGGAGFNPLLAGNPFAAQLGMQFQLQQLIANQQYLQQRGALGLYGQGLSQGGQNGQNVAQGGMAPNPALAGFGSQNMDQSEQEGSSMQGFQGGGASGDIKMEDPNANMDLGGFNGGASSGQQSV